MRYSLGVWSVSAITLAAMVGLMLPAGCASDDGDNSYSGGSAGGNVGGDSGGGGAAANESGGGGSEDGGSGGGAGSGCFTGSPKTVAEVAEASDENTPVEITGIVTSVPVVTYFNKTTSSCLWTIYIRDPEQPRGLAIYNYGDNPPAGAQNRSECPRSGGGIPFDAQPGDVMKFVGQTKDYRPGSCDTSIPKIRQVQMCFAEKTGESIAEPVVTDDLRGIVDGAMAYKSLLVKLENPKIVPWDEGNIVGYYGVMKLDAGNGSILEVHNSFYYFTSPDQQVFGPSTTFNHIIGVAQLDNCLWVIQPRNKCTDFSPPSEDCD